MAGQITAMFHLFFRLAFRNIKSQKLYTIIIVICLSAGLLTFLLTFLYIKHELSFDSFHTKHDRIYRLTTERDGKGGAIVPYIWGSFLQTQWQEVESVVTLQNITIALTVKKDEDVYAQHGVVGVDSTFFKVFNFPVIKGSKNKLLRNPSKIVITPQTAFKYFGEEDPIGKTLEINLWGHLVAYAVEGVVECPANSHLQFQILIPIHFVRQYFFNPKAFDSWTTRFAYTYILLTNKETYQHNRDGVRKYLSDFLIRNGGEELGKRFSPDIEPLDDIYLKSQLEFDFQPRGSSRNLRILGIASLGILFMAIINFINITSAQYLTRLKEIGLKKILGSSTIHLIVHLLMETILLSFFTLVIVCLFTFWLLPYFNNLTGKSFTQLNIINVDTVVALIGTTFLIGIISGLYPAIDIASQPLSNTLGAKHTGTNSKKVVRQYLVTIQFITAIILIVGTVVIQCQVRYMHGKDLGFSKDQIIVMPDVRDVATDPNKMELFRNEMLKFEPIYSLSASSSCPGQITWAASYQPEGFEAGDKVSLSTVYADHDFVKTYGLSITSGRDFDQAIDSDCSAFLINESAKRFFSSKDASWLTSPLTKKLYTNEKEGPIIGVVKDFHFESFDHEIAPLVIQINSMNFFNIQIKTSSNEISAALELIETTWKGLFPDIPFTYTFVDQEFYKLFESDQKLRSLLSIFTIIAVVLAMLSLFGLASFQSFEKAKEMSIRKVVGATETQLFLWLLLRFIKLILLANLIGLPISYFMMDHWLSTFAYRTDIPIFVSLISIGLTLTLTLCTVFYHVRKISRINPAEVLEPK